MPDAIIWFMAVSLGFMIGFSVGQASTCAVTAAKEVVYYGSVRHLLGFLIASGLAGLLCLPLAWTFGMRAGLPPETAIGGALVAGALLLAAGALVNDACLLGTLARLSQGEVRFIAVPVGIALGYLGVVATKPAPIALSPNMFGQPGLPAIALVATSGLLLVIGWIVLGRIDNRAESGRWSLRVAMAVLGGAGALLFVLTPGWTYSDAVRRGVLAISKPLPGMEMLAATLTAIATFAGAMIAGVANNRFRLQRPTVGLLLRSIAGGVLMAVGAAYVPGGNDNLLLWSVPGGSLSGLVAYVIMAAAIVLVLGIQRGLAQLQSRSASQPL